MANIQLTKEQVEELSTLLGTLTGRLQYRAMKTLDGSLDDSFSFWNAIEKQVAGSIGMQAYLVPSQLVTDILVDKQPS